MLLVIDLNADYTDAAHVNVNAVAAPGHSKHLCIACFPLLLCVLSSAAPALRAFLCCIACFPLHCIACFPLHLHCMLSSAPALRAFLCESNVATVSQVGITFIFCCPRWLHAAQLTSSMWYDKHKPLSGLLTAQHFSPFACNTPQPTAHLLHEVRSAHATSCPVHEQSTFCI